MIGPGPYAAPIPVHKQPCHHFVGTARRPAIGAIKATRPFKATRPRVASSELLDGSIEVCGSLCGGRNFRNPGRKTQTVEANGRPRPPLHGRRSKRPLYALTRTLLSCMSGKEGLKTRGEPLRPTSTPHSLLRQSSPLPPGDGPNHYKHGRLHMTNLQN